MIKEFIPYELALELKELGFNEPCLDFYDDNEELFYNHENKEKIHIGDSVTAPLYQQAFRWFRDKYNVHHLDLLSLLYLEQKMNYEEAELECLKRLIQIVKEQQ